MFTKFFAFMAFSVLLPGLSFAACTTKSGSADGQINPGDCRLVDISAARQELAWTHDAGAAEALWSVSASAEGATSLVITIASKDGAKVATDRSTTGRLTIADLGLEAGTYVITLSGRSQHPVALQIVQSGQNDGRFAAEPDGDHKNPGAIGLGRELSGRLMPDRSGTDKDVLAVTIDATTLVDAVLTGPEDVQLTLALLDHNGRPRQERRGSGRLALVDLGLTPGTHWFRVVGVMEPDQTYTLSLQDRGAPPDVQELEPNDSFDTATRMGQSLKGRITEGEADYLVFTVEGEPQLWRFQAIGDNVTSFAVHNGSGRALNRGTRQKDSRFIRLSNIYLVPGQHVVSLSGQPGPYLVRAVPMGPPPEPVEAAKPEDVAASSEVLASVRTDSEDWPITSELEPNDGPERAIPLIFGERQTGLFDRLGDVDTYAFHLAASQRVQIRLTADPEVELAARLNWGKPETQLDLLVVPKGSTRPLIWDGMLPAGDYVLTLSGKEALPKAYAIELIRRPYFDRTDEAEPNNDYFTATMIPRDLRVIGAIRQGRPRDVDWLRLPARPADTTLTIAPLDKSGEERRIDVHALLPRPVDGGWATRKTKGLGSVVSMPPEGGSVTVPAGTEVVMKISGTPGRYALQFGYEGEPAPPETGKLDLDMDLVLQTGRVAAFSRSAQTVSGTLRIVPRATATVRLDSHADDASWVLAGLPESVDLTAGTPIEIPVTVRFPADIWNAKGRMVSVRAAASNGDFAWTETALDVDLTAPEVDPRTVWPIPEPLLGGINVAAKTFGGTAAFPGSGTDLSTLIDGLVNEAGSIRHSGRVFGGVGVVLDLAGDRPHQIRALILRHAHNAAYSARIKTFSVSVSQDGQAFTPVGAYQMPLERPYQVFRFDPPLSASHLKIVAISSHAPSEADSWLTLDEIEVIAGSDALGREEPEIGLHARGGHVVSFEPYFDWTSVLNPDRRTATLRPNGRSGPQAEWVVGFLENRAARIGRMTWHDGPKTRPNQRAARISVDVSIESPYGPWTSLGEYPIAGADDLAVSLPFDGPVLARYVRFRAFAAEGQRAIVLPNQIEIREAPASADYRSILGAWGRGNRASHHEWTNSLPPVPYRKDDNDTRETADPLIWKMPVEDTVSLGGDVDWFSFAVPDPGGTFTVQLKARPAIEVAVELYDRSGKRIELAYDKTRRLDREYRAWLEQGDYFMKVTEIPRSVVVTWDTSGSVASYVPMVFRAVRGFTRDISGDREVVKFLPFGDPPEPLLDKDVWSDDPVEAGSALHTYDQRNHDSSNSEIALIKSMDLLASREGVRAIIAITDAVTDGYKRRPAVWRRLKEMRPRVFALTVPSGGTGWSVREPATALRDWAVENGGFNQTVSEQGAVEQAFRRVAAWLRRPAPYRIVADLDLTPPVPGFLTVSMDAAALARQNVAVEVILDASGSMLKRMDGTRRYLIAKKVLSNLVTKVLPRDIPFALRVFGQGRPDSCDTNLQSPLAPLNPAKVRKAIKPIRPTNLAKTPIGDALRHVGQDLAGVEGPRLVILLTDGEETCEGDPAAEITNLRASGFDVRINIVGFAIDDDELAAAFAEWAEKGGGGYFAASDAKSLTKAMTDAVTPPFTVLLGDKVVAAGRVNDDTPVELLPGDYTVRIAGIDDEVVRVVAETTTEHKVEDP